MEGLPDSGTTTYQPTATTGRRWVPLLNVTGMWKRAYGWPNESDEQVIPGWACCYLNIGQNYGGSGNMYERAVMTARDGNVVWLADKANYIAETLQNPALHVINGPNPILPGEIGRGTFDWPAQVLVDNLRDPVTDLPYYHAKPCPGIGCTVSKNAWGVYRRSNYGKAAFTYMGADRSWAGLRKLPGIPFGTGRVGDDWTYTGWINPATPRGSATGLGLHETWVGGTTAGFMEPFTLSYRQHPAAAEWEAYGLFGTGGSYGGYTGAGASIEVRASGVFWVNVSGTYYSTGLADGYPLGVGLYKRTIGGGLVNTGYGGWRAQLIDEIHEPYQATKGPLLYNAENIAFGGGLSLETGEQLVVLNTTNADVIGSNVILAAHRLG